VPIGQTDSFYKGAALVVSDPVFYGITALALARLLKRVAASRLQSSP
jgi:hypothetical protein